MWLRTDGLRHRNSGRGYRKTFPRHSLDQKPSLETQAADRLRCWGGGNGMNSGQKTRLKILAGIFLFAISPSLVVLCASVVASTLGCRLDEGNAYKCLVLGADIGQLLYGMQFTIFLLAGTLPLGGIFFLIVLIALIFNRKNINAPL